MFACPAFRVLAQTPPPKPLPYVGWFEESALRKSDIVVIGAVDADAAADSTLRPPRLVIKETLDGPPPGETLLLRGMAPRQNGGGAPKIYLLRHEAQSRFAELSDSIDLPEKERESRVSAVKSLLAIEKTPNPDQKKAALRRFIAHELASTSGWSVSVAIRELDRLSLIDPRSFSLEYLGDLKLGDSVPAFTEDLRRFADARRRIARAQAVEYVFDESFAVGDAERRRLLLDIDRMLARPKDENWPRFLDSLWSTFGDGVAPFVTRLLDISDESLRSTTLRFAAKRKVGRAVRTIERIMLADDVTVDVARLATDALGAIADIDSVPLLIRALARPHIEGRAVLALARINTSDARFALEDHLRALERRGDGQGEAARAIRDWAEKTRSTRGDVRAVRPDSAPASRPASRPAN